MRIVGILLILAAVALAAPAARKYADTQAVKSKQSERRAELAAQLEATRLELRETNLKYRGFQESLGNIPDSTKTAQSGIIMGKLQEYQKHIRLLEHREAEDERLIKRSNTRTLEANNAFKKEALPFIGGSAVLLLAGIVVAARPRRS